MDQGDIKHIALLESLLRRNAFDELVSQFSRLEVFFAIVDAQLGDENEDNKNKRRWELETFQGKAMIYKPDQGNLNLIRENMSVASLYIGGSKEQVSG